MRTRIAVLLVAVLIGVTTMASATVLRTRSWANALIPSGDNVLPDADGIGIPKGTAGAEVDMSRDNWPDEGVVLTIEVTYDFQTWVACAGPQFIEKGVFDPKLGGIYHAKIGCGWNPQRGKQPLRGRLRVENEGSSFRAATTVNFTD